MMIPNNLLTLIKIKIIRDCIREFHLILFNTELFILRISSDFLRNCHHLNQGFFVVCSFIY